MFGLGFSGKFDPVKDIPDLSGKVIIVTGGNAGLGKETIIQLAKHNPEQIYLTSRSETKATAAIKEIHEAVPQAKVTPLSLDLTDFSSIEQAAKTFQSKSSRLDILINNAGVMAMPYSKTKQGYEIQFGTNHVGHALFTKLLMPTMLETANKPGADVRVVNLSSFGHNFAPSGGIIWDQDKSEKMSTNSRYGSSKLANILHARILGEKYPQITAVAVHPGVIMTELYASVKDQGAIQRWVLGAFAPMLMANTHDGAKTSLWTATQPKDVVKQTYYYEPINKTGQGSKYAQDHDLAVKLWDWTEEEFKKHGY